MKAEWINGNILTLKYDTLVELLEATYRFSHCHEYPEWREKIFTKEELNAHYQKEKDDPTWWLKQWGGANLRDTDLAPFIAGKYGELDELEQKVVDLVKDKKAPYGIAMYATETEYVRDHELAHSLFYLSEKYRNKCAGLIEANREQLTQLAKRLSPMYANENLTDELHAYAGVFYEYWAKPNKINVPRKLRRELVHAFKKNINK